MTTTIEELRAILAAADELSARYPLDPALSKLEVAVDALRSSPAVDGVGEPVAWMATSQSGGVMVESANLKSILIERANTLYGNGAYELTPLCPNS